MGFRKPPPCSRWPRLVGTETSRNSNVLSVSEKQLHSGGQGALSVVFFKQKIERWIRGTYSNRQKR